MTFSILILIIIPVISIPLKNPVLANETEAIEPIFLDEEDILSMGVKWTYHRPDSNPEGNSTSWKLRWSPNGEKIAVVYFDNTTIILDGKTGKVIHALGTSSSKILNPEEVESTRGRVPEHTSSTRCWGWTTNPSVPLLRACVWSPDGKQLAISGDHKLIEIYNTSTWTRTMVLKGHVGSVLSLDWSPNGKIIASGEGTDQVLPHNRETVKYDIRLWDAETGQQLHTLSGHKDSVMSLSWSDDSSKLASASDDRNLKLWDANNGSLIFTMGEGIGHSAGVLDVYWSPNQTLLVSGSRDFKIRLWDARIGKPIGKPWKDNNCVRSTHWHPKERYIATAGVDQTLKVRDAQKGTEIKVFTEAEDTNSEVMSARWSPDGTAIAVCSSRDATVRLYSIGIEDPTTENPRKIIGLSIFFIVCIIGLIAIYLPLRAELRERRK